MRQDKAASLRERLRRGVNNFDFDALIHGVSNVDDGDAAQPAEPKPVVPPQPNLFASPPSPKAASETEGLRNAVITLGERLLQEAGRLAHALNSGDPAEGGYYLCRVNQVLDLLNAVDPRGDVARSLKAPVAPPAGRTWPRAAWSFYEFAESPLSGLLPGNADEVFCASMIAEAIASSDA